ncbi:hypothetical protein P5V15_005620 [Pogonomyrmex californicus]
MLLNFCDPRLRPEIQCSAISTEGYEVTNLISGSSKGYLAYSCIKPPIHIDITFLCNVRINHILIWPSVGSQKSSGFQLYSRNTDDNNTPYSLLSSGFLSPNDAGLLFYPCEIDLERISVPENFLRRYIKISMGYLTKSAHVLRITICKTENSVPALGKVEVWGTVSPRCGKDVTASVHALWAKHEAALASPVIEHKIDTTVNVRDNKQKDDIALEVPESFLDPITWELMTQPVILPSGKIIDQTTLEKFGEKEAIWGRSLSDPFTGIPFSEDRRPILATALKSRIDKFLLDNSNQSEIKKIPRVLGRSSVSILAGDRRRLIEIPKCVLNKNPLKRAAEDTKPDICKQITDNNSQRIKKHCHKLPAIISKRSTANITVKPKQLTKILTSSEVANNDSFNYQQNESDTSLADVDNLLDNNVKSLLSNMKRFNTPKKREVHNISNICECCDNSILYKLPCKHVVCRKILLSIENSQCKSCGFSYKSSEVERIHDILSR